MNYKNFDLQTIKTPVNVGKLKTLLELSNYDQKETKFLVDGFTNGFSIGYEGPQDVKITSPNLKFREVGDPITLTGHEGSERRKVRWTI